jgi:hypothetical protein
MPLDYLQSVKNHEFPLRVSDVHGVECVQVLAAAGLIDATFEPGERPGTDIAAVVQRITSEGVAALNRYAQGKPLA